jgi:hypothetical protein
MSFPLKSTLRFSFFACEAVVFAVPVLSSGRASGWDVGGPVFVVAWPLLLLTSIWLFRFDRRLAIVGLVSCVITGILACMPVLVV